jgi:phosphatidylserine/phosphatidylglycerophosphate/cardiolipin synthase-like enzyme
VTDSEVIFTRSQSGAETVEGLIRSATSSVVAALYRLSSSRLAAALDEAKARDVFIRICLNDNDHYEENQAAQRTLRGLEIPFRLLHGRSGTPSKMHHKFAVVDWHTVVTGSYNWTLESEERNYENLVVLRERRIVVAYAEEFEALWREGHVPEMSPRTT